MKKFYLLTLGLSFLFNFQAEAQNTPCVSNLGGGSDPSLLNFRITGTTLDHQTLTPLTEFYHEYPQESNTTATLVAGQEYSAFTFTSSEAVVGLWIDFNQNNEFEEDEYKLLVSNMASQNNSTFIVSADALPGNTKIRLRTRAYGSTITGLNACTSFGSGETRDYNITITAPQVPVCITDLGGGSDPSLLNFRITGTTLDHQTLTPLTEFYHEYPQESNTTATLVAGQEYSAFTFTSSEAVVGLWIDFNQNNEFEEDEYKLLVSNMASQNNSTFIVSADALPGNTKIRLRTRAYGSTITGLNACTSFGSGETRDYTVLISENLSAGTFEKTKNSLIIYPNPATNIVSIGLANEIKKLSVYGISGNLIATSETNTLNVSAYPTGIYIVKALHHNGQTSYGKVVKQ